MAGQNHASPLREIAIVREGRREIKLSPKHVDVGMHTVNKDRCVRRAVPMSGVGPRKTSPAIGGIVHRFYVREISVGASNAE
jgi:hypothetical protein